MSAGYRTAKKKFRARSRKEQTEKFALSAIGYTFAVLGVLILLSMLIH